MSVRLSFIINNFFTPDLGCIALVSPTAGYMRDLCSAIVGHMRDPPFHQ